jgi:hypothetical protein
MEFLNANKQKKFTRKVTSVVIFDRKWVKTFASLLVSRLIRVDAEFTQTMVHVYVLIAAIHAEALILTELGTQTIHGVAGQYVAGPSFSYKKSGL